MPVYAERSPPSVLVAIEKSEVVSSAVNSKVVVCQYGAETPVLSSGTVTFWEPMVTMRSVAPGWLVVPSVSLT